MLAASHGVVIFAPFRVAIASWKPMTNQNVMSCHCGCVNESAYEATLSEGGNCDPGWSIGMMMQDYRVRVEPVFLNLPRVPAAIRCSPR